MPAIRIFVFSVFLAALAGGCSRSAEPPKNEFLARFANETIVPGVGLGDLRLGKTTLKFLADNTSGERVSTSVSDYSAIELSFFGGEAAFLFPVFGDCARDADSPRGKLRISTGIDEFLAAHPSCGNLTLSSISVSSLKKDAAGSFFKGATSEGVRLGSPVSETSKHGPVISRPGQMVAAEGPDNLERSEFAGGIYFYFDGGIGPTDDEIGSGQPLSPERIRQIDESHKEALKNRTVKRIRIFVPE